MSKTVESYNRYSKIKFIIVRNNKTNFLIVKQVHIFLNDKV